MKDTQDT